MEEQIMEMVVHLEHRIQNLEQQLDPARKV